MAKPSLTMFDSNLRHSCNATGCPPAGGGNAQSDLDCGPLGEDCSFHLKRRAGASAPLACAQNVARASIGQLKEETSPDTSTLEQVTYSDMRALLLRVHETSGNLFYLLEDKPDTARYTPSDGISGAFHALMRDCSQLLLNDGMLDRHPL